MKLGISTNKATPELFEKFDMVMHAVKSSSGREVAQDAWWPQAMPVVSCFGHTKASVRDPSLAPVSKEGLQALPGKKNPRDGFAWGWVCPNADEFRQSLVEFIAQVAQSSPKGLHLESVCFPEVNYCHCQRCLAKFEKSGLSWTEWRAQVITEFVGDVHQLVGLPLSLTVHPDPYYAGERFGLDMYQVDAFADFFLLPIYCLRYDLPYWIDTLLYAFTRNTRKPLWVELYAVEPDARGLARGIATLCKYPIEGIVFYDDHHEKFREVARLFREDVNIRSLVRDSREPALEEVTERMAAWGETADD